MARMVDAIPPLATHLSGQAGGRSTRGNAIRSGGACAAWWGRKCVGSKHEPGSSGPDLDGDWNADRSPAVTWGRHATLRVRIFLGNGSGSMAILGLFASRNQRTVNNAVTIPSFDGRARNVKALAAGRDTETQKSVICIY